MEDQPQETPGPQKPPESPQSKPALTVVIQSWWTPALAVIMLVVGLLVGYFGHSLLVKTPTPTAEVAAVLTPTTAPQVNQTAGPTSTIDPTMAAISNQTQLMDYLVANTTHWQGDPNAKVTLIEFSDYQ